MGFHVGPVDLGGGAVDDRLDIDPVPVTASEELEYDQVFGGTGAESAAGFELEGGGPVDAGFFKG